MTERMHSWAKPFIAVVVVVLITLGAYIVAGPYLAVRAIRSAIVEQDAAALAERINFPALRANLKAQLSDQLVREAGIEAQSSLLGTIGLSIAAKVSDGLVETMITPLGLGAMMEGRKVWRRFDQELRSPSTVPPLDPLQNAHYRYQSLSRFTATITDDAGSPIVFVFTRDGLRWRLSDIRLPM